MRRIFLCLWACLPFLLFSQTRFDYFYLEAEKSRLAGDYSSAAELYRHCLEINPDAPEAIYNMALIQIYLRQDSLGTSMLRRAAEIDSCNPWYLETLASAYLGQKNVEEALPVMEKLSRLQTKRSDVLSQLAGLYKSVGRTQDAIDALDRIELLEGKSVQLSVEKFSLYMDLEEKDKAYQELNSLCNEFPNDLSCKVVVGNQYQRFGEVEKAKAVYDEVMEKDPANIQLQVSLMDYYEETGDMTAFTKLRDSLLYAEGTADRLRLALMRDYISRAERDSSQKEALQQAFDYFLKQPQKDADMLFLKAAYLSYEKVPEDSIMQVMHKVLEIDPANKMALSELLQYYAHQGEYLQMEDICRMGMNHYPEELGYAYYLGLSLYQQKKVDEASDAFLQGLRTRADNNDPELISDLFSVLGDIYMQKNMQVESFAAYDSALVYKGDNIGCLNNYAYYLSQKGERLDEAEEMSYHTIKAEPDNKTYLDTYAWILFCKKEYTEARIYIDRVVSPEATDEAILADSLLTGALIEHAGDIYSMCGLSDEALRLWKLALRKKDDTVTALLPKKIRHKKYKK